MKCNNCGYEHNFKFCPKCGSEAAVDQEYTQYREEPTAKKGNKGLGIASFAAGIAGLAFLWCFPAGLPMAIAAFVLGGISQPNERGARGRRYGKLGIILNCTVGFLFFAAIIVLFVVFVVLAERNTI